MDVELLKFNDSEQIDDLRTYVKTLDTSYVSAQLSKIVWTNDGAVVLQTLLNGIGNTRQCFEKKLKIAELILGHIEGNQLPAQIAEKLVNVLAGEIDDFPPNSLVHLVNLCCDMIRTPKSTASFSCWKELLPKLLHLLLKRACIDVDGSQMSGEEFKNSVITSLCMADWSASIVVDLAAMFIDMPMVREERARVVRKMCSVISKLPADEIPTLAHQMLLLTHSENSMVFFLSLASYFNTNLYDKLDKDAPVSHSDAKNIKIVSKTEGAILYHVVSNPGGCKELLKILKSCVSSPQFVLQPFLVTLLLALSSVSAHEAEVLATLRFGFNRALNESDRLADSAWLREVYPPALQIDKLISRVLENCFRGRDAVLKGLVNLAFHLLSAGRGGDGLHALGMSLLENLVRRNKLVTGIILDTLNNHIYQAADSSQYTDCLTVLTRKQPMSILECQGDVAELIDSCLQLPARTASQVLTAVLPLARLSHPVRDNFVAILRKALFPHDVDRRIMAVRGFLEILRDLKISNLNNLSQSMSQNYSNWALASQSLGGGGGGSLSNEGLCLEILTVLREVFKHQHQVKTILYKGLFSSVRANADLGPHALDYLQTHMEKWYEEGDKVPPLRFHDAVLVKANQAVLVEPLGDFILCLSMLVTKLEDTSRRGKLQDVLNSLCARMASCTINHFHLEPEEGFILDATPEAMKSQEVMRLILSVYEALMGYLLCAWNKDGSEGTDKADLLWSLFKGYTCLGDYARGLGKTDKKKGEKKGKPATFRFPTTVLNFKCCSRLLTVINKVEVSWASEESMQPLCGKRELHRYAVQVVMQMVQDANAKAVASSQITADSHNIGYLCVIARILYSSYISQMALKKGFDVQATVTAFQAFLDLFSFVLTHFKSKVPEFLCEIAGEPAGSQKERSVRHVLQALLDQADDVLGEEMHEDEHKEDQQAKKMPLLYLALVTALVQQIPAEKPFMQQVYEKVRSICCEKKIERPAEAKALVALLLMLHRRCSDSSVLLLDIAGSLSASMELIDEDMEIEAHTDYKIVNRKTGNLCLVALCESLQLHLADVEWTVNRFKAELVSLQFPSEESSEMREEMQRSREADLCRQLSMLVRVLRTVCLISVAPGVFADAILRTLELTYSRLSLLTKYYIAKVSKFKENLQGTKYEKTVRLVDSDLTKNMYCFTEHVISDGTSDAKGVNPNQLKARAIKETKLIPKVVLEKEQYHKLLLQLSKRAKYDMASKLKHAMTRDYRIYTRQLKEILENERIEAEGMDIEEDQGTEVQDHSSNENETEDSPVAKRRRSNVITYTQETD